ncbi:ankyrin repeat domain-containing protein 34B [Ochotona curzoniae]|uniref:ankyrin repeat domain-containing protein 34B n=1 Tax=Ochotona curzoniae TaxID=130825 RepID=UPI001B345D7F|nr:ankyrin repeat domain-containing protein 34B [Ochotona curzoniae]
MDEGMDVASEGNSLIKAVHQCRLRLTRLLLEGGAYINESNERGETPLMVACKSRRVDPQGVSRARMVKYLLENHADPDIQDKSGRTALMHACLGRAGPQVVSLLLEGGADLSLQDHSGSSALVYAINADDRETLQVLLSACKAKGKEVIIITTAKSPCGRLTTKQYLNTPPAGAEPAPATCATPSDIDLSTASSPLPHPGDVELVPRPGLKDPVEPSAGSEDKDNDDEEEAWDPGSPGGRPVLTSSAPKLAQARSWSKSHPSLMRQHRVASLQEELPDITPEEELCHRAGGLALGRRFITRHQSIDVKDTAQLLRAWEQASSRKTSYEEPHRPSLAAEGHPPGTEALWDQDPDPGQPGFTSTLRSIVQKRNSGANHYSSDSQLSTAPNPPPALEDGGGGKAVPGKKKILSPSPSLLSESTPPGPLGRRHHPGLERRGSGAVLLEQGGPQPRPGFLPPLPVTPHPPFSEVSVSSKMCGLLSCGQKVLVPTAPGFPKEFRSKKMLLRRQSLQTEQIKQLVNF